MYTPKLACCKPKGMGMHIRKAHDATHAKPTVSDSKYEDTQDRYYIIDILHWFTYSEGNLQIVYNRYAYSGLDIVKIYRYAIVDIFFPC